MLNRREFMRAAAAGAALSSVGLGPHGAQGQEGAAQRPAAAGGPVVVASANGLAAVQRAMDLLRQGSDPVDAVVAGVNLVEADPNDDSVGLGGLPNEDGVVELDSSVMHGPTHKAGAVAALRNIVHASSVALRVMRRTDHVLLVGEGALRFARAHGFKEEELLTERAREAWLRWKENLSPDDDWLPEEKKDESAQASARRGERSEYVGYLERRAAALGVPFTYGTINCCTVDARGDIGGVTTTSGLAYKIPGRVGDSPIIGAGLYVDNGVGAAGSTGRGEANLQNCSSFAIVEFMRGGMSPEQASLEAAKRIADRCEARLRRPDGRPDFDVKFYAVHKDGRFGGAALWKGGKMAVCDAAGSRLIDLAYLYER